MLKDRKCFNINSNVIIYPNESGWNKIIEITKEYYDLTDEATLNWIEQRKISNGFEEQMWVLLSVYHEMFFNGQQYFTDNILN